MSGPRRLSLAVAGAAAVVMAGAQIAIPLASHRAGLSSVVVVCLAASAVAAVTAEWGLRRALLATVVVTATTLAVEVVGVHTGWPFGAYHYSGALRPSVAGVPVIVPLGWLGMGLAAWELAGRLVAPTGVRLVVGAGALTAWDLFLDPQMTRQRYWVWSGGGAWRGVPLSNYAGWLLCSMAVMGLLACVVGGRRRSRPLLALFSWMAVMETLGFVLFFDDAVVALVGGVATLPLVAAAWHGRPAPATVALPR